MLIGGGQALHLRSPQRWQRLAGRPGTHRRAGDGRTWTSCTSLTSSCGAGKAGGGKGRGQHRAWWAGQVGLLGGGWRRVGGRAVRPRGPQPPLDPNARSLPSLPQHPMSNCEAACARAGLSSREGYGAGPSGGRAPHRRPALLLDCYPPRGLLQAVIAAGRGPPGAQPAHHPPGMSDCWPPAPPPPHVGCCRLLRAAGRDRKAVQRAGVLPCDSSCQGVGGRPAAAGPRPAASSTDLGCPAASADVPTLIALFVVGTIAPTHGSRCLSHSARCETKEHDLRRL